MSRSGSEQPVEPVSIEVRNLSLIVPYFTQPDKLASSWLSALVSGATSLPRRRFATLIDNMSFTIREGERVALIGRNGAGKSTLLRVLTGAFEPTLGSVKVTGSKQAMLSVGIGFNAEATVMENIFLRGAAMGVPANDIRGMVEPVLEFSGLRDVANRRLFTLSSGQRVRLGFALSTTVQTDVLLLDEWFGAGDASFVRKAKSRMMDRVGGSKIVVLASHSDRLLRQLCNRALLIDQGRLLLDSSVDDVLAEYRKLYPRNDPAAIKQKKQERRLKRKAKRLAAEARAAGIANGLLASPSVVGANADRAVQPTAPAVQDEPKLPKAKLKAPPQVKADGPPLKPSTSQSSSGN